LIPGSTRVKWIGVRLRYSAEHARDLLTGLRNLYAESRFVGRAFDASFNEEAARDEVRSLVELELIRAWRGDGILLLDGPIFPSIKAVGEASSDYSAIYGGIAKERVEAVGDRRVVGVVKRLSRARYLARCLGVDLDDASAARRVADQYGLGGKPTYIGPIEIKLGGFRKYAWYVVIPGISGRPVLRVESLSEGLGAEVARALPNYVDVTGTPTPISVADRLARRLSAAAYKLAYAISPIPASYEALEELSGALRDLGEHG